MTSSSELRVVAGAATAPMQTPELRQGTWTRFGDAGVRGDATTEALLGGLAERTRTAARSQGYAVGWAEGCRAAQAEAVALAEEVAEAEQRAAAARAGEHAAAVAALHAAAARLDAAIDHAVAEVEAQASDLALALTETLVGHELRSEVDGDVVRRALAALPAQVPAGTATVRTHPRVAASTDAAALAERGVSVVADAGLGTRDAVVELSDHRLEIDLAAAVERLRGVLR